MSHPKNILSYLEVRQCANPIPTMYNLFAAILFLNITLCFSHTKNPSASTFVLCWGIFTHIRHLGNKEQSESAKNAELKRLLKFSLSPCVSKTSISKSKIHLYCKHFWSASLNCADLFLIKAQKRRNTLCIPSIFNTE